MANLGLNIQIPYGADQLVEAALRNVVEYINAREEFGPYFPPFLSTDKPNAADWTYRGIFLTDLNKPAWSDGTNWRLADGTVT